MAIHSSRGIWALRIFFKLIHVDSEAQETKNTAWKWRRGRMRNWTLSVFFIDFWSVSLLLRETLWLIMTSFSFSQGLELLFPQKSIFLYYISKILLSIVSYREPERFLHWGELMCVEFDWTFPLDLQGSGSIRKGRVAITDYSKQAKKHGTRQLKSNSPQEIKDKYSAWVKQ